MRLIRNTREAQRLSERRRGSIVVLTTLLLVGMFAFMAFSIDLGFIGLTRSQMQTAADSAALAAAVEVPTAWGPGATATTAEMEAAARAIAAQVAQQNKMGAQSGTYVNPSRDVRFGLYTWSAEKGAYVETWDNPPFNMVEVTVRRNVVGGGQDAPVDLFFGPVIGHDNVALATRAAVALLPGSGFRIEVGSGGNAEILPITFDLPTWNAMMAGSGNDRYAFDVDTGAITKNTQDRIREIDLYPTTDGSLPAGNRGTVDFGESGNSSDDIKRQILYGLNEADLQAFGQELNFDDGPFWVNGDTGISAGFEAQLKAIKGLPRAIPIFDQVTGPGNNAYFQIVKFVGIRILDVKLTGGHKYVIAQPAPFVDESVIRSKTKEVQPDSIFSPAVLIR